MPENPEMPDAASVLIGPGGNGIDANALRPEIGGQIADGRFERRLCHTHHVVVLEDALAAQVGEREDAAAAAALHQRQRAAGERNQASRR